MDLTLIAVPYDLGREDVGSGRGPGDYLSGGAAEALRARGHDVRVVTVHRRAPFAAELEAVLDVNRALAATVAEAVSHSRLPLVLAGNCNAALGVHAGLQAASSGPTALVWLDAHGDFNTPEITTTGYLDGMPLAMLTGRAYPDLWSRLGGAALPEHLVLHAGGRDLDTAEARALTASDVAAVSGASLLAGGVRQTLAPQLAALAARARSAGEPETAPPTPSQAKSDAPAASSPTTRPHAYLHLDIDVLDPGAAPGVTFPSPGGLSMADLLTATSMVHDHFTVTAFSLASLTPEHDEHRATMRAGLALLNAVTSR